MKKQLLNSFLSFIILILLQLPSIAQVERIIQFNNPDLNKDFIARLYKDRDSIEIQIDSIILIIDEFLSQRGYLNYRLEVDSGLSDKGVRFHIKVFEGKKYLIKKINSIEENLSDDILRRINTIYENAVLSQANVQKAAELISELLESEGYPFAEVIFLSYRIVEEKENEIFNELIFSINKDRPAVISRIEILGNKFTERNVIIREMRIPENEFFTPQLSQKIIRRLNRLNIFSYISIPEFFFDDSLRGFIKIEVKETNTNTFDGIIGYIPSQSLTEKGYLTGQINLSLRNLFGTLRAFSFRWNRLNRLSQDLEIKYFEPWFLGFPLNITPIFQQLKQDTTYIQRTFSGQFDLVISETFSILLNLSSSQVIPQSNYFTINVNRSSSFTYGLGIIYDLRDNPLFTRSGLLFRTDFNQIRKKEFLSTGELKYLQQKGSIAFSIYQPIFRNQILYLGLNVKAISGDGISVADLFRFGGANSLRGYEENQFSGSRIFWSNFEYRFFTNYTDYLSAFFDYGYYFREIMNEKISKFKYGYGVGLAFNTGIGLFRVNYALGEKDTFSRGKIHFGFVSLF